LNGRNVFNLIELVASVVPQAVPRARLWVSILLVGAIIRLTVHFGNQSAEYLDGQPLNIGYINLPVLIPTQDSIQEFRVQTSNLGPEWGKFSGGVTNLSTKSGTNSLHGEAYEYVRTKSSMPTTSFSTLSGNPGRPGCKTSSEQTPAVL